MRNAGEVGTGDIVLHCVDHGREGKDAHSNEEQKAAHLLVALAQGKAKGTQPRGVAGQLEDAEDAHEAHDAKHLSYLAHPSHLLDIVLVLGAPAPGLVIVCKAFKQQLQIEGQDGNEVYCVEGTAGKAAQVWGRDQAQQVLQCEECNAQGLNVLQDRPAIPTLPVYLLHLLYCVECQGHHRDQHEEAGGHCHHFGSDRREGFLHEVPEAPALGAVVAHVVEEMLILLSLCLGAQLPLDLQLLTQLVPALLEADAAAAGCVFETHAPVAQLLQEATGAQLVPHPQHPRGIEIVHQLEDSRVPVKEILIDLGSVVIAQAQLATTVGGGSQAAQASLGIDGHCLVGEAVTLATNVDVQHGWSRCCGRGSRGNIRGTRNK